ncbi:MAG: hypothetical protein GX458_04425 [Phyllobacteriaceae bacterium]|nr:hypothetical protein [Phyllobacteriaceae bacterium]
MTHSARHGLRLLSTSIYLSLVGLFSTASSLWVLTREVDGNALSWVTWLSVLGAFVALPTSILAARRLAEATVRVASRA